MLDLDRKGPDFACRALEALLAEGAPLHGLSVYFEYIVYNWSEVSVLRMLIELFGSGVVRADSSEGGLFEYASHENIIANLKMILEGTPDDFVMIGQVVRDEQTLDPRLRITVHVIEQPVIRYLCLAAFQKLADHTGWWIAGCLDGPTHLGVTLKKATK